MTNPPSHRCENYFEPDQLRGDLDSKNNVSKYRELLILFVNLQITVLSFPENALFSFLKEIYMNVLMLHLRTNFSCKKFGLQRHNGDLLT